MLVLIVAFILGTDLRIVFTSMAGNFATILKIVLVIVTIFALMTCMYIFPVLSRFENSIKYTIKNAFLMSLLNLPRSLLILLVHALPILLLLVSTSVLPILFLLGMATVAYLCSTQYVKIFKKYEPEEEADGADGEELAPLSFIVEEEKAKMEAIAAEEAAQKAAGQTLDAGAETIVDADTETAVNTGTEAAADAGTEAAAEEAAQKRL